jgi:hypothetical protein
MQGIYHTSAGIFPHTPQSDVTWGKLYYGRFPPESKGGKLRWWGQKDNWGAKGEITRAGCGRRRRVRLSVSTCRESYAAAAAATAHSSLSSSSSLFSVALLPFPQSGLSHFSGGEAYHFSPRGLSRPHSGSGYISHFVFLILRIKKNIKLS